MNGMRQRWVARNVDSCLKVLPVTVVTGARQTGKTTLVRSVDPARTFLSLDDVGVLDQATRHPESLLGIRPVTLDEVQRTPALLLAVKAAVDQGRRAGDFLLTGSANLLLLGDVADTLAGRAVYLELPPFCPTEWGQRRSGLAPLDRLFEADFDLRDWPSEPGDWPAWLLRGGFPPEEPGPGARRGAPCRDPPPAGRQHPGPALGVDGPGALTRSIGRTGGSRSHPPRPMSVRTLSRSGGG